MIKFASLPAQGFQLWENYWLHIYGLKEYWLENPEEGENGWLKPYLYDAFLKYCYHTDMAILPHAYGYEHAVISVLTDRPINGIRSWDFKRVINVHVDVPEAPGFNYLHVARIYQDWDSIGIEYEDGSKEEIDMAIFEPYRTTKPLRTEQKVQAVRIPPVFF